MVLLKFLRAREWDVEAACKMLYATLEWRKEFRVDNLEDEHSSTAFNSHDRVVGQDVDGGWVLGEVGFRT